MLCAALEFSDFAIIGGIVALLSGGAAVAASRFLPGDRIRLHRVEHKLDMILAHMGVKYTPPDFENWQELAHDPATKIAAIKAYREQHGVGLKEAKDAVEQYMAGRR